MFTGIITAISPVIEARPHRLAIQTPTKWKDLETGLKIGESIAINGVCLTLLPETSPGSWNTVLEFDVSQETLSVTNLGSFAPEGTKYRKVNLERSLRVGDRLSGHWVTGHVDAVGTVASMQKQGDFYLLKIQFPNHLAPFIAKKGSITVDGVSLTVNSVDKSPQGNTLDITLIPHTVSETRFHETLGGAPVNLEVDLLARYVAKQLEDQLKG